MIAETRTMIKAYLGDGIYVAHDDYNIVLTTENGLQETNRIVLEPEVYENLTEYVALLREHITHAHAPDCLCDRCARTAGTYAYNLIHRKEG